MSSLWRRTPTQSSLPHKNRNADASLRDQIQRLPPVRAFDLCYATDVIGKERAEAEARAAHRRSTWQGGVAKLADMEAVDDEFWGAMLPADRFIAVWEASREQYGIDTEASSGLRGSVGGVRRR
jgi:hypothetical protein